MSQACIHATYTVETGLLYFQCSNTMAAADAAAEVVANIAAGSRTANGGMISVLTGVEL